MERQTEEREHDGGVIALIPASDGCTHERVYKRKLILLTFGRFIRFPWKARPKVGRNEPGVGNSICKSSDVDVLSKAWGLWHACLR
jgi:hypothetical protein